LTNFCEDYHSLLEIDHRRLHLLAGIFDFPSPEFILGGTAAFFDW
jgi:hypothetical protein